MRIDRNYVKESVSTVLSITSFRGNYAFLSNFYPAPVIYLGKRYANNEAAFQAQKTSCAKEQQRFCLPYLTDPAKAKSLGRKVTLRPDWDAMKIQCMYEICMCKFFQHTELRDALLATGNTLLVEGNTWGDYFWGQVDGIGENHLGIILMDIREKLRCSMLEERRLFSNEEIITDKRTGKLQKWNHRQYPKMD